MIAKRKTAAKYYTLLHGLRQFYVVTPLIKKFNSVKKNIYLNIFTEKGTIKMQKKINKYILRLK